MNKSYTNEYKSLWGAKPTCYTLFAVWFYSFFNEIYTLYQTYWRTGTDIYGIFILPIVAILAYQRRALILKSKTAPNPIGALLIFIFSFLWLYSKVFHFELYQSILMLSLIPCFILYAYGMEILMVLAFPIIFLFLMIPWSQYWIPILLQFTLGGLKLLNSFVPLSLTIEQLDLNTPFHQFNSIALLPSIRYHLLVIIASLLISPKIQGNFRKIAFFILFNSIPLCFNSLGLAIIFYLENRLNHGLFTVISLIDFSWILLFSSLIVTTMTTFLFKMNPSAVPAAPLFRWGQPSGLKYNRFKVTLIASLIVLSVPWIADQLENNPWRYSGPVLLSLPSGITGWEGPYPVSNTWWKPSFPTAVTLLANYRRKNRDILFFLAFFDSPRNAVNINQSINQLFNTNQWDTITRKTYTASLEQAALPVQEYLLTKGGVQYVVWQWYFSGPALYRNARMSHFYEMMRVLYNTGEGAGTFAILTKGSETTIDAARKRLTLFLNEAWLPIQALKTPSRQSLY